MHKQIRDKLVHENESWRECFKTLQTELLEIVKVKQEVFEKRYEAEFKDKVPKEHMSHTITPVNTDFLNCNFDETGDVILKQF